jgi:26-hydroxylase
MSKIYGFVRDSLTNFSEEMSMVNSTFTLGVFILTIVSLRIYQMVRLNKKLPPGPTGYPFVGMLPYIERDFHLELFDFSKSFGKIFSMRMGNQLIVVLSDHKLIKAAFGKSDYSFRPKTEFGNILGGYGKF